LANKFGDNLLKSFEIIFGILNTKNTTINAYHASFFETFLVEKFFEIGASFCFEMVMLHASNLDILASAKKNGYKTYFYLLFTDNVNININSIKQSVAYGKHNVSDEKVINWFYKKMDKVKKAVLLSDKVFLLNYTNIIADMEVQKGNNKIVNTIPENGLLHKYI
jgi:predicted ABC-type ATPase